MGPNPFWARSPAARVRPSPLKMKRDDFFVTIPNMKQPIRLLLLGALLLLPSFVFCGEPLMLINPGRETFLNFPSATVGNDKTVTVFLPEPAVPLRGRYPVVYLLGPGPQDAPAARQRLEASARKAILVAVDFEEQELADTDKIAAFFSRELVPYIDVNYPTVDEPSARAVAVAGAAGARAAAALLAKKNVFARALILNGGMDPVSLAGADPDLRVLLAGGRAQIAVWQQTLQEMGKTYGPGFITVPGEEENLLAALDLDYLLAPSAELAVKKLKAQALPAKISLEAEEEAVLSVRARLANGREYAYIPLSPRFSPPYLDWDAATGRLEPIPGAVPGKVKISGTVDKTKFSTKIRLKK